MRNCTIVIAILAVLLPAFSRPALAQQRVGLVIGVGNYDKLRKLDNPAIDARAIVNLMSRNGIVVYEAIDKGFAEINDVLVRFEAVARNASEAWVYLAGHGFERGGVNVFAAKDADIECASEAMTRSIHLSDIYRRVAGAHKVAVFLDACRNDPFPFCPRKRGPQQFRSGMGFGDLQGDPYKAGSRDQEILIATSTARGEEADDGDRLKHSPYAKALIGELSRDPTIVIGDVLARVAREVQQETSRRQRPTFTYVGEPPEICLQGKECKQARLQLPPTESRPAPLALPKSPGATDADKREHDAAEKAAADKRERDAAEKAAADKREREAAEKAAADKRARESAEKAAADKREREAAEKAAADKRAREAAEKAAAEKREREAAAKAVPKPPQEVRVPLPPKQQKSDGGTDTDRGDRIKKTYGAGFYCVARAADGATSDWLSNTSETTARFRALDGCRNKSKQPSTCQATCR
ncbi:MAG: caspase domain-containing protein [Hyphomicrobiaceae bacterium]